MNKQNKFNDFRFEVYIIWDWKEEKVIGYLEDYK